MRRMLAAALMLTAPAGCRDGVPPFSPAERMLPDPNAYQLTFGAGSDRDPIWLPSGDTLLYHTDTLHSTLPDARGVMAAIPVNGGRAAVLFPEAHLGRRLFAAPVVSPSGDHVAYMDVGRFDFAEQCHGGLQTLCENTQARLDSARLRVRRVGETRPFTSDPSVRILFEGRTHETKYAHLGPYYEPLHPFQAEHLERRTVPFRPSWSPDGSRLAYSDGLALRIWEVGSTAADVVPGSMDAVGVAWSPDGEWLAFTHLQRGDSVTYACACGHDVQDTYTNIRVLYDIAARVVTVMRPDGSGRRELAEGADPAWSPDGRYLYATQDDRIVRIDTTDGTVTPVPNTTRGRTPAVSPDGRWLAFARRKPSGDLEPPKDHDIWVIALQP